VELIIKFILLHELCSTSCRVWLQWSHNGLSFTTNIHINLELFFSTLISVLSGRPAIIFLYSWRSRCCFTRSIAHISLPIAISSDSTFSSAFIGTESVFIRSSLHLNLLLGHVNLWVFSFSHWICVQEFPFVFEHALLLSVSGSQWATFGSANIWLERDLLLKLRFMLSLSNLLSLQILILLHNKSLLHSQRWESHSRFHLSASSFFIHLLRFSVNSRSILVLFTVVLLLISSHHMVVSFVFSKLILAVGIQIDVFLSCVFNFFRCE